jgi:hypothetical protein
MCSYFLIYSVNRHVHSKAYTHSHRLGNDYIQRLTKLYIPKNTFNKNTLNKNTFHLTTNTLFLHSDSRKDIWPFASNRTFSNNYIFQRYYRVDCNATFFFRLSMFSKDYRLPYSGKTKSLRTKPQKTEKTKDRFFLVLNQTVAPLCWYNPRYQVRITFYTI